MRIAARSLPRPAGRSPLCVRCIAMHKSASDSGRRPCATGAAIRIARERAATSVEDVSPGIKLSRTSSLPRPAGRNLLCVRRIAMHKSASDSGRRPCATGAAIRIARERAATSAEDVSPGIKLSRTSSLPRPAGRSLLCVRCIAMYKSASDSGRRPWGRPGRRSALLAKRPVQSLKIGCLNQRLREQCGSPPLSHRSV
ncbi:hypothetical protein AN901_200635 [Pseudomonas syringae pv. theae]|nr:hypothetical protein AN901_200635 [Pseudomonas syringae pv. theae]